MSQEFNTLELARIYERQGYFQDAFDMYQALSTESEHEENSERGQKIDAGLKRMTSALENQATDPLTLAMPEKKMDLLLEQWLKLLILQKRVDFLKQVTHR